MNQISYQCLKFRKLSVFNCGFFNLYISTEGKNKGIIRVKKFQNLDKQKYLPHY